MPHKDSHRSHIKHSHLINASLSLEKILDLLPSSCQVSLKLRNLLPSPCSAPTALSHSTFQVATHRFAQLHQVQQSMLLTVRLDGACPGQGRSRGCAVGSRAASLHQGSLTQLRWPDRSPQAKLR